MVHYIKQHSTLPKLKLQLTSGNIHNTSEFMRCIKNAVITFDMIDTSCNQKIVACRKATLEQVVSTCEDCDIDEYVIVVPFNRYDTSNKGTYKGSITINFNETGETLIAPVSEELFIKVV